MNFLLTCDQVFDRLTRGPFSGRDDGDDAVEEHLAGCHECRSLAEALRPAVALFHDGHTDPPQKNGHLPVYLGRLPAVAEPCQLTVPDRTRASFQGVAWQMVAAALVGVLVGAVLTQAKLSGSNGRTGVGNWLELSHATPADAGDSWTIASLRLSQACRPPAPGNAATPTRGQVACCTRCHFAHSAHAPPVEASRLLVACLACHGG